MAEEMTPEQYKEHKAKQKNTKQPSKPPISAAMIGAALIIAFLGFACGVQYQKSNGSTKTSNTTMMSNGTSSTNQTPGGFMGRRGGGMMGAFGSVTAISDSSITIKDIRQNDTVTFSITNGTTITNNGATAKASDIKVGDRVIVRPTTSSSKDAASILVNPQFPGGPRYNTDQDNDQYETN